MYHGSTHWHRTRTGERQGPEQSPGVGHASKTISLNGIANEETLARRIDKPCERELVISNENHSLWPAGA
jgi:hypothetical protein